MDVRRIDFGYFIRPSSELGPERAEPCLGYLIDHPDGLMLIDTGMGSDAFVDGFYQPRRTGLPDALARVGVRLDDIRYVANCHLHFDHCGGNPLLPGRPVFCQRAELDAARHEVHYTMPELIDAPGVEHVELDGETEVLPGVLVLPTPGHTAGHQSFVVRQTDGTVVVAGQSHNSAAGFTYDALAARHGVGTPPAWMKRVLDLDPRRVVFAHDNAVWEP